VLDKAQLAQDNSIIFCEKMTTIIDGSALAQQARTQWISERTALSVTPTLVVVQVGDHAPSRQYIAQKIKAAQQYGIAATCVALPENTSLQQLESCIAKYNQDQAVHGIIIQLPLPSHIPSAQALSFVSAAKDVDALHPLNQGWVMHHRGTMLPPTPSAVLHCLRSIQSDWQGARMTIVGASVLVGRPLAMMALAERMTVTVCHQWTTDVPAAVAGADIVVTAVGGEEIILPEHIAEGAVVIDVGARLSEQGTICGDVSWRKFIDRARAITPVPGGVGPLTVHYLMCNVWRACEQQQCAM